MHLLISTEEFQALKGYQKIVPLRCEECGCTFHVSPVYARSLAKKPYRAMSYCSRKCSGAASTKHRLLKSSLKPVVVKVDKRKGSKGPMSLEKRNHLKEVWAKKRLENPPKPRPKKGGHKKGPIVPRVIISCKQCCQDKLVDPWRGQIFCSKSCATKWKHGHKTKGYRRSKLELWIEQRLGVLYPDLKIDYCRTDAINAELDIYIPSLKLGVEINGVFHYEPIYGPEQLARVQNNDRRKFQACLEKGIEFCVINTGKVPFSERSSVPFLAIVKNLIDMKLETLKNEKSLALK